MIDPKLDSQRPLTGPAPRPGDADETAIAEAISGKMGAWGTHGSRAAGTAVRNIDAGDTLLVSADVLRATGDAIKNKTGSSRLGVIGELTVAITKLSRGNMYRAAYHTGKAVEAFGLAASQSRIGALANAMVLAVSPARVGKIHGQVEKDAKAAFDDQAPDDVQAKAFFDLSKSTWQLAYQYRVLAKAAVTVTEFSVGQLAKTARFAARALKWQGAMGRFAASSLGRAGAAFIKWVPLVNVVGVAVSAKNAVDVFKDGGASRTSTALAAGSVVLAGAGLWAAISLGFWPFLGLTALGIGVDLALLRSRKRDRPAAAPQITVKAEPGPDRPAEGR